VLDDRGIVVGFPTGARVSHPLQGDQTSSGTCPVSYLVNTVGSLLPGVKELAHETDHSLLSRAKVKNAWNSTSTPDMPSWHTQG
jgi:hypothetical protein